MTASQVTASTPIAHLDRYGLLSHKMVSVCLFHTYGRGISLGLLPFSDLCSQPMASLPLDFGYGSRRTMSRASSLVGCIDQIIECLGELYIEGGDATRATGAFLTTRQAGEELHTQPAVVGQVQRLQVQHGREKNSMVTWSGSDHGTKPRKKRSLIASNRPP